MPTDAPTGPQPWRYTRRLDAGPEPAALVGERGAGLARLIGLGLPVPGVFAITADAFRAWRRAGGRAPAELVPEISGRLAELAGRRATAAIGVVVRPSPAGAVTGLGTGVASGPPAPALPADDAEQVGQAVERLWVAHQAAMTAGAAPPAMAVLVQRAVPLAADRLSGAGVLASRDPLSGSPGLRVWFRSATETHPAYAGGDAATVLLRHGLPQVHERLEEAALRLEMSLGDMCALGFRVDRGRLWLVDGFAPARSGRAAVRVAVDMVDEGHIDVPEALRRIPLWALEQAQAPVLAFGQRLDIVARGTPIAPGAGVGTVLLDSDGAEAPEAASVLIAPVHAAQDAVRRHDPRAVVVAGAPTASPGRWALATRPAICRASDLRVEPDGAHAASGRVLRAGETVSVDGRSGVVAAGEARLVAAQPDPDVARLLLWAQERRDAVLEQRPPDGWPTLADPQAASGVRGPRAVLDPGGERDPAARSALLRLLVDAALEAGVRELGLRLPDRLEGWDPQPPLAPWRLAVASPAHDWAGRVLAARLSLRQAAVAASPDAR